MNKHSGDSKHSPVEEFGKFPTKLLKILSARRCWKFNQPLDFTMENLRHHVEVWSCRGRFSRNLEWSFGTGSWGTTDRWCRDCFFGYNDMICGGSRGSKNVSWKRFFFFGGVDRFAKREAWREHIEESLRVQSFWVNNINIFDYRLCFIFFVNWKKRGVCKCSVDWLLACWRRRMLKGRSGK